MEDLPGYLTNATASIQGRKKSMDSHYASVVQKDTKKKGRNGEVTGLFGVYAGYGGPTAAELARQNLITAVTKDSEYATNVEQALQNAATALQRDIFDLWRRTGSKHGVSVAIAAVRDGHLYILSAGHTAAVLCRAEGEIEPLTEPSSRLDEHGPPSMRVVGLDWEDEFVIIACNGFWSKVTEAQAVRMARVSLRKFRDVNHAVQKLSYAAYVNGASSNITITIIVLNQDTAMGHENFASKLLGRFRSKKGSDDGSEKSSASASGTPLHSPRPVLSPTSRHKVTTTKARREPSISRDRSSWSQSNRDSTPPSRSDWFGDMEFDSFAIQEEMAMASKNMDFERAATMRDRLKKVDAMNEAVANMKFEEAARIRDELMSSGNHSS